MKGGVGIPEHSHLMPLGQGTVGLVPADGKGLWRWVARDATQGENHIAGKPARAAGALRCSHRGSGRRCGHHHRYRWAL